MRFFAPAAAAACALLLAPAAPAQPREYSVEEIAGDLAFGFCPLFLANGFALDAPELTERGFSPAVQTQENPRFGPIRVVTAKRSDGEITFGGAAGKVCTVVVTGERRAAALAKLREAMAWTGLDFKPAAALAPPPAGVTVETYKAPVEGQFLVLQLAEAGGPTPSVLAQLFATDK